MVELKGLGTKGFGGCGGGVDHGASDVLEVGKLDKEEADEESPSVRVCQDKLWDTVWAWGRGGLSQRQDKRVELGGLDKVVLLQIQVGQQFHLCQP